MLTGDQLLRLGRHFYYDKKPNFNTETYVTAQQRVQEIFEAAFERGYIRNFSVAGEYTGEVDDCTNYVYVPFEINQTIEFEAQGKAYQENMRFSIMISFTLYKAAEDKVLVDLFPDTYFAPEGSDVIDLLEFDHVKAEYERVGDIFIQKAIGSDFCTSMNAEFNRDSPLGFRTHEVNETTLLRIGAFLSNLPKLELVIGSAHPMAWHL